MDSDVQLESIHCILKEILKDPDLSEDQELILSGKLTSLLSMNLILKLESEFSIRIPNSELKRDNLSNAKAIVEMVRRNRK